MTATNHLRAAARILDTRLSGGLDRGDHFDAVNSNARIALAMAMQDLADAAKTDAQPTPVNQGPWPDGVTARILTRVGMRSREFAAATVDVHDNPDDGIDGRSTARCQSCGWSRDSSLALRDKVLELARDHASDCTALPQPAA